jgi:hypothetical protein
VECASGFCADSVCCDDACDGLCEECNDEGSCEAVSGIVDELCQAPFECVDRNVCLLQDGELCGFGASCASDTCVNGFCCGASCADGSHCDDTGLCSVDVAAGGICDNDFECASGYCIDGVCCNNSCSSQPDRRCARCTGQFFNLCNPVVDDTTEDCNGDMACSGGGVCEPSP